MGDWLRHTHRVSGRRLVEVAVGAALLLGVWWIWG